jgi:hypothetical protein
MLPPRRLHTTLLTALSNSQLSSHLTRSAPAESFVTFPVQVAASALLGKSPTLPQPSRALLTISSFESRDICDEVIREFNNTPVSMPGGEEHSIQIRFSDTHEQKMLKQQTAAGRVFRAAEYEVGVAQARALGTPDRYLSESPTMPQSHANEFELFMNQAQGQRLPWAPPVPSTLGPARPSVYYMPKGGPIKSDDGASENGNGVEVKTNPATPVKADDKSSSPSRVSARND